MDLTTIKVEIKAWERAFRAKHSRDPNVEDIKCRPDIAAKYKLYKNLSKQTTAGQREKREPELPSTPPRRGACLPGPSSIVPKARAKPGDFDPFTPNPFSPVKFSSKDRNSKLEVKRTSPLSPEQLTTPPRRNVGPGRTPSPDPFPPFEGPSRLSTPELIQCERNTVRKARKRLRGDVLSPTPNRVDKKRRTTALTPNPSFQVRSDNVTHLAAESRLFNDAEEAEASYMDESPVKVASTVKNFKLLFDETPPQLDLAKPQTSSLSQSKSSSHDPFLRSENSRFGHVTDSTGPLTKPPQKRDVSVRPRQGSMANGLEPPSNMTHMTSVSGAPNGTVSQPKYSRKRTSSDAEELSSYAENGPQMDKDDKLLPPSPTPTSVILPRIPASGLKASKRLTISKKKTKLAANDEKETSEDDQVDVHVYEVERELRSRDKITNPVDDDPDLELSIPRKSKSGEFGPADSHEAPDVEELEVNLPDSLRSVLHISSSHAREREERALVDSLLHGKTSTSKYGEIWGIGEVELSVTATDDEDDWAGEGVPWEAAEL